MDDINYVIDDGLWTARTYVLSITNNHFMQTFNDFNHTIPQTNNCKGIYNYCISSGKMTSEALFASYTKALLLCIDRKLTQ